MRRYYDIDPRFDKTNFGSLNGYLEDLLAWPIDRITHTVLIREAWQHRHNVSAYDAFYVAAARVNDASLLTADGPLARAPALGIVVQNMRMA